MLTYYEKRKLFESAARAAVDKIQKYLNEAKMHGILPELCGYLDGKENSVKYKEYLKGVA